MSMDEEFNKAINQFKGTLLIGPRSFSKTQDFHIPQNPPPPCLPKLNFRIRHVESLRPNMSIELKKGGRFLRWFEHIKGEAKVIETTKQGNHPAVLSNDNLYYITGWPCEIVLNRLIKLACRKENIKTISLPKGVRLRETKNHQFFFNYGAKSASILNKKIAPASAHWERSK